MEALLVLEDGKIYRGESIGAEGETEGEVVFNTSMTGYQEILTDPSYAGQIITMTYPLIGNYGVNQSDCESDKIHARGIIVKELCDSPSNWRLSGSLKEFLQEHNTVGISKIDTRDLTIRLRSKGTLRGIITTNLDYTEDELRQKVQAVSSLSGKDFPRTVTSPSRFAIGDKGPRIALLDLGAKKNIINSLVESGCQVSIVPCWSTAQEILDLHPDGIMLSNGPGDPEDIPYVIKTVQELLGKRPIFGICLGHQILGLACGAKTYKMKFGHRGGNHPVKDLMTGRTYITSQNHGFAIDTNSLSGTGLEITHLNLNDGTVEGIRHRTFAAFSVQYHPEASPGPEDSHYLFGQFIAML